MAHEQSTVFKQSDDFFNWMLETLQSVGKLTEAEVRVCEHLMLGRRYADIAAMENVSIETVRWHTKRILKKVDVESTREFTLAVGRSIDERRYIQQERAETLCSAQEVTHFTRKENVE